MRFARQSPSARAFTRRELLVVVAVVCLLGATLPVAMDGWSRGDRERVCSSNLRQLAIAQANYATDFKDQLVAFSWRAGNEDPWEWPEMTPAQSDLDAVSNEMVNILRFRGERADIQAITGWLPGPKYTPNILNEYIASRMPMVMWMCPEDAARTRHWQERKTPPSKNEKAMGGEFVPPPAADNRAKVWPYSSSYEFIPASFSPDQATADAPTIAQGRTDGEYTVPLRSPFGPEKRKLSEVTFPNQKVGVFDSHDRHSGSTPKFYADPSARQPLMFYDVSVRSHRTRDADPGFQPNNPTSPDPTVFDYNPEAEAKNWYPPPANRGGDRSFKGYYRWTRSGLKGRDFGGAVPAATGAGSTFADSLFEAVYR